MYKQTLLICSAVSVFSLVFAGLHFVAVFFLLFIAAPHLVALALWPLSLILSILWVTLMATIPDISTPGPQAAQATIPTVPTVEELVQDQSFYIKLCEEQLEVFGQNSEEFTREYNLYITQLAKVAKPGQNWHLAPQDQDAFIAEMKRRCQEVPQSIAE